MAIVCTLKPWSSFTPLLAADGIRCRFWKGRRSPRSNTEPRSTQNGSARWPAKTLMLPGSMWLAAFARSSYLGVESGPIGHGGVDRDADRAHAAIHMLPGSIKVFAGQRADP